MFQFELKHVIHPQTKLCMLFKLSLNRMIMLRQNIRILPNKTLVFFQNEKFLLCFRIIVRF